MPIIETYVQSSEKTYKEEALRLGAKEFLHVTENGEAVKRIVEIMRNHPKDVRALVAEDHQSFGPFLERTIQREADRRCLLVCNYAQLEYEYEDFTIGLFKDRKAVLFLDVELGGEKTGLDFLRDKFK